MAPATPALRIAAKRDGFRRAGMRHPAKPVEHKPGTFTAAQVEALKAEPNLIVEELGEAAKGKAGAEGKAAAG